MRINRRLNLVLPVETEAGRVYVHSTPISRDTFEANFLLMSKAFAAIFGEGLGVIGGPRIAGMMLRKIAADMSERTAGASEMEAAGLMAEIRRLTNVVRPSPQGWFANPFDDAVRDRLFDDDDLRDVENAIVFFTLVSAMFPRNELESFLNGMNSLWDAQIVSSNCTEFAASLPISTATDNSGATATISSVPS